MNFLYTIISKWPFKVATVILIGIIGLAIGVSNISLSTGNDTLIESTSDTYLDNSLYQQTFGGDPIIIVFNGEDVDDLLSYESLSVLYTLSSQIEDQKGVFVINSPIQILDYIGQKSFENYENGLVEIANGLSLLSSNLSSTLEDLTPIDQETLEESLGAIATSQETMSEGLDNQATFMENTQILVDAEIEFLETEIETLDPVADATRITSLQRTITVLTGVTNLYTQLIPMTEQFSTGTSQTSIGITTLVEELSLTLTDMSTMIESLPTIQSTLQTLSTNILNLATHFNQFEPTFPREEETLQMMIYPNGTLNPMLQSFLIDEEHLYMSIILEEGITQADMESLLDVITVSLEETIYEDALVSGKPVLDYDIRASMMSSMQVMMISAGVIMILVLLILFPVPFRILPLIIVLVAVIGTIGIMGWTSIPLTMVSMAVFPVLIGLGIDYSIQFHSRYTEEIIGGETHE